MESSLQYQTTSKFLSIGVFYVRKNFAIFLPERIQEQLFAMIHTNSWNLSIHFDLGTLYLLIKFVCERSCIELGGVPSNHKSRFHCWLAVRSPVRDHKLCTYNYMINCMPPQHHGKVNSTQFFNPNIILIMFTRQFIRWQIIQIVFNIMQ